MLFHHSQMTTQLTCKWLWVSFLLCLKLYFISKLIILSGHKEYTVDPWTSWVTTIKVHSDYFQYIYGKIFWRFVTIWKNIFFSPVYFIARILYIIYIQNMCWSALYSTSKATSQWWTSGSYILGESKVTYGFSTAQGLEPLTLVVSFNG